MMFDNEILYTQRKSMLDEMSYHLERVAPSTSASGGVVGSIGGGIHPDLSLRTSRVDIDPLKSKFTSHFLVIGIHHSSLMEGGTNGGRGPGGGEGIQPVILDSLPCLQASSPLAE